MRRALDQRDAWIDTVGMRPELANACKSVREAATRGRLIVFVGAGASMDAPASLPSWPKFCSELAARAEAHQPARAALIRDEVSRGNLLEAGNLFANLPRADKERVFTELFERSASQMPATYGTIAELPATHWFTTNFDPLLRHALIKHSDTEILENSDDDFRTALSHWSRRRFGIYLHGRHFKYDTLVYNTPTYANIQNREPFREVIKRAFLEHKVLFYGYSCSDPDIVSILEYIANRLGGAGTESHILLTSSAPPALLTDILHRANVQVVQYSSNDNHQEAKELLKCVRGAPRGSAPSVLTIGREEELEQLAVLLMSLRHHSQKASTYRTACAALVMHAGRDLKAPIAIDTLVGRVAHLVHTDLQTARKMVEEALTTLNVRFDGSPAVALPPAPPTATQSPVVLHAIEKRLISYYSSYTSNESQREAIQAAVSHVMLAQGMTVARALAGGEDLGGYDLDALIAEALKNRTVQAGVRSHMARAIAEILRDPDDSVANALFELANAAYTLELVFLNPLKPAAGAALGWKLYVDSNVALRLLAPTSRRHIHFKQLLEQCRRIGIPLAMLHPFVDECMGQIEKVHRSLDDLGLRSQSAIREYVETLRENERSPILDWYFVELSRKGTLSFAEFRRTNGLTRTDEIIRRLANFGIATEEPNVTQKLDTADRESLWADLRNWRHDRSVAGRTLRRNEATQVEWIVRMRDAGARVWFLSDDAQLRRALLTLRRGFYAGYVMTPTALAHHLAQLHWGEVDLGGFSALLWTYPRRTAEERARDMVLRTLAQQLSPGQVEAEWMRDQVEELFRTGNYAAVLPPEPDDPDNSTEFEKSFLEAAADLIPRAVEKILDSFAQRNRRTK